MKTRILVSLAVCTIITVSLYSCVKTEAPLSVAIRYSHSTSAGIAFDSESTHPVVTCSWDFGDGAHSADASPIHVYASRGTYTVNLNVCDVDGRYASTHIEIQAGHDWQVPRDGGLQPVVDKAVADDTIFVASGTHSAVVGKDLDIRGSGGKLSLMRYEGADGALSGFTIAGDGEGSALTLVDAAPTVRTCTFSRNTAHYGAAVFAENSASSFHECRFSNNTAVLSGGAVYAVGSYAFPSFYSCVFQANHSGDAGGAILFRALLDRTLLPDTSLPQVEDCVFSSNTAKQNPAAGIPVVGGAIHVGSGCRVVQVGNTFTGNAPEDVIHEDALL